MARKETIHNNQMIQNELRFICFNSLSSEAKEVMRGIIQESTFLGKHRVPEEDVFAIVKNAPEFSEVMVFEHLKLFRQNKNQNYWIGPYISIHFLSLNPLLVRRRRYSRGERYPSALCGCHSL